MEYFFTIEKVMGLRSYAEIIKSDTSKDTLMIDDELFNQRCVETGTASVNFNETAFKRFLQNHSWMEVHFVSDRFRCATIKVPTAYYNTLRENIRFDPQSVEFERDIWDKNGDKMLFVYGEVTKAKFSGESFKGYDVLSDLVAQSLPYFTCTRNPEGFEIDQRVIDKESGAVLCDIKTEIIASEESIEGTYRVIFQR